MALGALGYVGYGIESVEGTAVAPTKYLPVSSFSFEDTNDYIVPDQIRHSRDNYITMAAPYAVSGTMEMELIPNGVGHLLKSAFAATIVTSAYAGGGYQHVMTPAASAQTFSFESSANDVLVMRYAGCRVNTIEIKAAFGEIVTASFGIEGVSRAKQGAPSSPTYINTTPFHFSGVDIKAASGTVLTTVKEFTFGVNNNVERVGTLRKTRSWLRMDLGKREVTLSLTMDFADTAEYDRFLAETVFDVDISMFGPVGTGMGTNPAVLRIQIPAVRWNKVGVPLSAGDMLEQSVEALIVAPIGGNIFTATFVCDEPTIV
jgi:hypothetical protein